MPATTPGRLRRNRWPSSIGLHGRVQLESVAAIPGIRTLDERLSAFSHTLRNAGKVAFFPKCFVWIHWSTPSSVEAEHYALFGKNEPSSPSQKVIQATASTGNPAAFHSG